MYRMYKRTFYVREYNLCPFVRSFVCLFIIFQKVVVLYGVFEEVRAYGLFGMLTSC
jgi:hypothetical protein